MSGEIRVHCVYNVKELEPLKPLLKKVFEATRK